MVEPRLLGIVTMIVGALLGIIGATADYIGITETPRLIGEFQWVGIAAGAILLILGLTILLLTMSPKSS